MGHTPPAGQKAARNIVTTRYFAGAHGMSNVPTGTPHVVINAYLVRPGNDQTPADMFNYMVPVSSGTRRVVINLSYNAPSAFSKGQVPASLLLDRVEEDLFGFQSFPEEVLFVFNSIPDEVRRTSERVVDIPSEPTEKKQSTTEAPPRPKTAVGLLSFMVSTMALCFKMAYFKKLPHASKFVFVGANQLDPSAFEFEDTDDLLTEVCEGIEANLRDPVEPPRGLVDPKRELTEGEVAKIRHMAFTHIELLTHAEYKAVTDPAHFALEAEHTMHLYD